MNKKNHIANLLSTHFHIFIVSFSVIMVLKLSDWDNTQKNVTIYLKLKMKSMHATIYHMMVTDFSISTHFYAFHRNWNCAADRMYSMDSIISFFACKLSISLLLFLICFANCTNEEFNQSVWNCTQKNTILLIKNLYLFDCTRPFRKFGCVLNCSY